MASASSLVHFNNASNYGEKGMETIEIDPQFAQGIGLIANDIVRALRRVAVRSMNLSGFKRLKSVSCTILAMPNPLARNL